MSAIELELFRQMLGSIADEMGIVLRKTAYSANIKERRDYSCAIYDRSGNTVAMGEHMPVHLGAMPLSVEHAREAFRFEPGDVVVLNDPFRGGTHLPDITAVSGVFLPGEQQAVLLCCESSASRGCRRHEPRVDAAGARDLPGRHSHSARPARSRRQAANGDVESDSRQRTDAGRAGRRSAGAVDVAAARRRAAAFRGGAIWHRRRDSQHAPACSLTASK